MQLKLQSFKGLLAMALLVFGYSIPGQASHYMGSDITYLCVSPNVYVVTGKIYRDCSGAGLSTAETLSIKSPGCNANGRTIPMPLVPGSVMTGITMGLYCPSAVAQAQCNSSSTLPNFETGTYRTTVTFTAAEQTCQNWYFSMRMGNRPTIENLVNGQGAYLYSEAYLKLGSTINNNSPEFAPTNIPIPFVGVNQDVTISMNASEADGDSVSYELSVPLNDYNTPIPYAQNTNPGSGGLPANASIPLTISGQCIVYNTQVAPSCAGLYKSNPLAPGNLPLQTAILPSSFCTGQGQSYSATRPLPVGGVTIDWVTGCKTNIQAAAGGFNLDPLTGVLRFRPNVFHPSAPSAGRNKYAVVVQINEWRKINGVMTKIGHIRRDMLVIVGNYFNLLPAVNVPNPNPNTGSIFIQDTVFNVMCCTTTSFSIRHMDLNPSDLINVTFPDAVPLGNGFWHFPTQGGFSGIPGLLMKPYINNQNAVNIGFYMTPNTSAVGNNYYLRSIIKDNACPSPGRIEQTYRIHIIAGNRVAPVANNRDVTIGAGQSHAININFQRPDSMIQNNVLVLAQYTYFWTENNASGGIPNGLNAVDRFKKNIVVSPSQATRYFLTVTNQMAGCQDTTSVIVRIGSSTGMADQKNESAGISVFPNPFSDRVNFGLNFNKITNGTLIIYNILGQETDRIGLNKLPAGKQTITWMNAHKQPAGQYVAKLVSESGQSKTVKFIKLQ